MRSTEKVEAPGEDGGQAWMIEIYEELRRRVLGPVRKMPTRPRSLGLAVLLRGGMREWMKTISSLRSTSLQTNTPTQRSIPSLPTSTQEQLAATLATLVLSRFQEVTHEP